MAWVLVVVTAVLAVLVLALAVLVVGLGRRVRELERPGPVSSDPIRRFSTVESLPIGSLDADEGPAHVVIARPVEPVATVPGPVFADLVLKETVVQTASLLQGVRRALAPETRNRIRFHMRQEVKRSRKQRRTELREVRREWQARQRESAA